MIKTENFEKIEISSAEDLRAWLLQYHTSADSYWLVTYKKVVPDKYVSREEVLDELIVFGWIDGIRRKLNDRQTMQLISPRKTQYWAKTYKDRATKLIAEGRMHEAGLQSIEVSKQNGLWHFMDDVDQLIIPKDLKKALEAKPEAFNFFDAINDSSKRFVLRWLKLAKTEKTRLKRIERLVDLSQKVRSYRVVKCDLIHTLILFFQKPSTMQKIEAINIMDKFTLFEKQWTPHIIGELNGQHVKLCKLKDEFIWHSHEHEDELFMVFQGTLYIDFRDQETVAIKAGEIIIVPKGVEHRPYTKGGEIVFNLLFEPKATKHTGEVEDEWTVKELE